MSNAPSPYTSEIPEGADLTPIKYFIVLVENEYAGIIGFPDNQNMESVIAGLSSNPTIVPCPDLSTVYGVGRGWIWDGTSFSPPVE